MSNEENYITRASLKKSQLCLFVKITDHILPGLFDAIALLEHARTHIPESDMLLAANISYRTMVVY